MKTRVILAAASLFWAAACLLSMLQATGGGLSMPLDDSFIFFQYARRCVEGAPFSYQSGDGVTAGATSLLTMLVHALGYLVGFRGEAMAIFALILGAGLFAWAASSAWVLGRRLCPRVAWAAPALLLVSGPLIWGFMSGMDLPLFVALALAMLARWPAGEEPPPRLFFVAGLLLGLSRPDALFLVVPAFLLGVRGRGRRAWWALPLGGVALPFLVQWVLTGAARSASMDVKSVLGVPGFSVDRWLVEGTAYLTFVVKGVLGGGVADGASRMAANDGSAMGMYILPLALPFLVLGIVPGAYLEGRERRPGIHLLLLVWMALLVLAQSFTVPHDWHWNRYLMPVYALALPAVAVGIDRAGRLVEAAWSELRDGEGARALALLAVLFSLPSAVFFLVAYGRNCADIRFQHIELARRLNAMPDVGRDTLVGVHDVGALAYFGEYRVLDLEGLASPDFRVAARMGGAGAWETLERSAPAERPRLLAVYDSWFDPAFVSPHRLLFAQRQFRPSIAAGNPLQVYAADWSAAGNGDLPRDAAVREAVRGAALIAEVDVGDHESEAAAAYRFEVLDGAYNDVLQSLPASDGTRVMEGGRVISGGERFHVDGVRPGDALLLVARTSAPFRIRVAIDGRAAGVWTSPGGGNAWVESLHRIQAPADADGEVVMDLRSDDPHHSAYAAFHYWVYRLP